MEPRRWTVMPAGMNVIAAGYGRTNGDLFFDPVLEVKNADISVHTFYTTYVRAFTVANKSVRFDALIPWINIKWDGLLKGKSTIVERSGFADPRFRFSMILLNTAKNNTSSSSKTVLGTAISLGVPLGNYYDNKLLNIGKNRYTIRPQIGIVHTEGKWSYELTGSIFFFTDNNKFNKGNKREQDPLYAVQSHLVYTLIKGVWTSVGIGYGWGGLSHINGVNKDDKLGNVLSSLSFGFPLTKKQGMKLTYINGRTQKSTGGNLDTISIGWSMRF